MRKKMGKGENDEEEDGEVGKGEHEEAYYCL